MMASGTGRQCTGLSLVKVTGLCCRHETFELVSVTCVVHGRSSHLPLFRCYHRYVEIQACKYCMTKDVAKAIANECTYYMTRDDLHLSLATKQTVIVFVFRVHAVL